MGIKWKNTQRLQQILPKKEQSQIPEGKNNVESMILKSYFSLRWDIKISHQLHATPKLAPIIIIAAYITAM